MIMESGPNGPDSWFKNLEIEIVEEIGGRKGGGSAVSRVYKVTNKLDNELHYFRLTGYYDSYNGTDWDNGLVEILPQQVTVTKYY